MNTTVTRLIPDKDVHQSPPSSVINSIIGNDEQIVENVLEGLVNGIGIRAHRMYSYGKRKYTYGLPSKSTHLSDSGLVDVESAIETLIAPTATIVYYHFGPMNNLHMGWLSLVNDHGYVSSTNTLTALSMLKGVPVYLKDMRVVLTQASYDRLGVNGLEQWGTPPTAGYTPERTLGLGAYAMHSPYVLDTLAVEDSVLVSYVWQETSDILIDAVTVPQTTLVTDTLVLPFPTLLEGEEDADYFHVKYLNAGNEGYWVYKHGAGTLPELDQLFNAEHDVALGSFFPIGYYRYNKVSAANDPTSEGYKTSKKLASYLGINYADMIDLINSNPDIADVEQALLMMAVPANTTNQIEQRYLYDFFDKVAIESGISASSTASIIQTSVTRIGGRFEGTTLPKISFTIQDARFRMVFGCDAISRTKKAGVIASVGSYNSVFSRLPHTVEVQDTDGEGQPLYTYDSNGDATPVMITNTYYVDTHFYRYQLSDSVYEEVKVSNLKMMYYVWGGMVSVGDDLDPILLIPLDYSITRKYNIPIREELFARSLHLVFNSHTITKIKWYQRGIFKIIIIIIAIVIAYYTGYFDPLLLAAAAGGTTLAVAVITAIIKYIVVSYVLKLFVKAIGPKAAFLVAIIAVIAAAYGIVDAGSLSGAPWAQQLLSVATNLTSAIGDAIQQELIQVGKDFVTFGAMVEKDLELIEKAKSLLEQSVHLSPFVIFGESPDDFYNRTVHSGNIGVSSLDAITYYVDTALTLPELVDTIGSNEHG